MSNALRAGLLFALANFLVPAAVSAFPMTGQREGIAQAAITKAGCYDSDCCGCCCPRWGYGRRRYYGYWRPRYYDPDGYYHSRYYSHYRWGSYHRLWRPYPHDGGWYD